MQFKISNLNSNLKSSINFNVLYLNELFKKWLKCNVAYLVHGTCVALKILKEHFCYVIKNRRLTSGVGTTSKHRNTITRSNNHVLRKICSTQFRIKSSTNTPRNHLKNNELFLEPDCALKKGFKHQREEQRAGFQNFLMPLIFDAFVPFYIVDNSQLH